MLIIYNKTTGLVESISGYRTNQLTTEMVDSIQINEPLGNDSLGIRIYDFNVVEKVFKMQDNNIPIYVDLVNKVVLVEDIESVYIPTEIELLQEKVLILENQLNILLG